MAERPKFILLMGVSGCGKSTVGPLLAEKLGGLYVEGDDLHPPANKEKMGSGTPLQDEDRWPWFENINHAVAGELQAGHQPVVVACSALKRSYRDHLFSHYAKGEAALVYMRGDYDLIADRLTDRDHEYMPASLLKSQFDTLEEPGVDESPLVISIAGDPPDIAASLAVRFRIR